MSFVQILYLPAPSLILQQTELNVSQQLEQVRQQRSSFI